MTGKGSLVERGPAATSGNLQAGLHARSIEHITNDDHFGAACSCSTLRVELVRVIGRAPSALAPNLPVDRLTARTDVVDVVSRIADAGALAVRSEASEIAVKPARGCQRSDAHDCGGLGSARPLANRVSRRQVAAGCCPWC